MTDASALATIPAPAPAAAPTPATADLQPAPAMTVEQAQVRKSELFATKGFAERVARGNSESVRQWREVTRALFRPAIDQSTIEGQQYAKNMDSLAGHRARADISDENLDWVAAKGPVSPAEKEKAAFALQRFLKNKALGKKALDGDRALNTELAIINMILGSPTGTLQEIEDFKKAAAKRLAGTK